MAPRTPDEPGNKRGGWTGISIKLEAAKKLFDGYATIEKIELGYETVGYRAKYGTHQIEDRGLFLLCRRLLEELINGNPKA